jgi:hypothetical protein
MTAPSMEVDRAFPVPFAPSFMPTLRPAVEAGGLELPSSS